LVQARDYLTRSLCSDPITGPSTLVRIGPSQSLASVLSPHGWRRLGFSLSIKSLVPAVPRESLYPTHAPSTPAAACPVIRHLADLSQDDEALLVLTTPKVRNDAFFRGSLSFVFRTLTCSVYSELFIRRSPPRLFTAAARTGLRPAP